MVDLRRDTIPEDEFRPLDEGWDARLEGHRLGENPWAVNNWKHFDWEKGWRMADESDSAVPMED